MKPFKQATITIVNVLAFIVSTILLLAMLLALTALASLDADARMFGIKDGLAIGALTIALLSFGVLELFILYPIFKKYNEAINNK